MRNYILDPVHQMCGSFKTVLQVSAEKLVIADDAPSGLLRRSYSGVRVVSLIDIVKVRLIPPRMLLPGSMVFDLDRPGESLIKQFKKLLHGIPTGSISFNFSKDQHDRAVEIKAYVDRRKLELANHELASIGSRGG